MSLETRKPLETESSFYKMGQCSCSRAQTSLRWHTREELACSLDQEGRKGREKYASADRDP